VVYDTEGVVAALVPLLLGANEIEAEDREVDPAFEKAISGLKDAEAGE
jgi:hypothetical protein